MKRILLGSSALCAVALAGPAFAQTANEPVKLGLGGYWNSAYGDIVSQSGVSSKGKRHDDIQTDAVLNVKGSTKLDNGLTVGASIQIRAQDQNPSAAVNPALNGVASPDTIKRSYGYIRGAYGEFRIGDDDDARRQKALTAPCAGGCGLFGANTPEFIFGNNGVGTNSTQKALEAQKRVSRIAYFTPTIAGFSFAVSYAPGGEKGSSGAVEPNTSVNQGTNVINNAVSIAGGYSGKFGDFSLDAYAGGSSGHRVRAAAVNSNITGRDNPVAVGGGAVVGFGPFKFGGAYEYLYDRDLPASTATATSGHQARNTWDVGGEYIIGPFSASLGWTRGIYQNIDINSSARLDVVSLATDYVLGPGIDVGIGVDFTHQTSSAGAASANSGGNYNGLSIMAAMGIGF
jgi:outer membrane protein OmpU